MSPRSLVPLALAALAGPLASACDSGAAPPPGEEGVPNLSYCDTVSEWDEAWTEAEWEVLELLNRRRARGADCGDEGSFEAAEPLAMHPALRCAARLHSLEMSEERYFDEVSPSGERPQDRMLEAGYEPAASAANIAWGHSTPEEALSEWMADDRRCANAMSGEFLDVGVGFFPDRGPYWTLVFGAP